MNLSKHFKLNEFLESQTATRLNIQEQFNPNQEIITNLKLLCTNILEPLRLKTGALFISSGYRCKELNKLIGGSENSQHLTGEAVDLKGLKVPNIVIFQQIQKLNLPFDQLIHEYGTKLEPAWVHVSFTAKRKPRKQILYLGIK